jgi:hypothetical protein
MPFAFKNKTVFFGSFCSKSSKIRPQIFSASLLFIRPLLSYVAEYSASWQHSPQLAGSRENPSE